MIENAEDIKKNVIEDVNGKKLLVKNSLFTCMCKSGTCFRHCIAPEMKSSAEPAKVSKKKAK